MTAFVAPLQRNSWQALQASAHAPLPHLRDLLQQAGRAQQFQIDAPHLHLDFSRQRINADIWTQLQALASESGVLDPSPRNGQWRRDQRHRKSCGFAYGFARRQHGEPTVGSGH